MIILSKALTGHVNIKFPFLSGYDSDVAREKNMDYGQKTYENPIRETTGVKPHEQEYDDHSG